MGENQEEQQEPILRSINNDHRVFVKFINKTPHNVNLYWIDYQGQAVTYGALVPNDYVDINTFVTHPWIFVDTETMDRYTVNQKDVFFPELMQRPDRVRIYITLPLYTLRELSLRAIRKCLKNDLQAFQLDIPRSLQYELALMLPRNEDDRGTEETKR